MRKKCSRRAGKIVRVGEKKRGRKGRLPGDSKGSVHAGEPTKSGKWQGGKSYENGWKSGKRGEEKIGLELCLFVFYQKNEEWLQRKTEDAKKAMIGRRL